VVSNELLIDFSQPLFRRSLLESNELSIGVRRAHASSVRWSDSSSIARFDF
jgi:hypothetical protein